MALHVGKGAGTAAAGGKPSWLLSGDAAQKVAKEHKDAADERKADRDKSWRFYMKPEASARIFFLNGDLVTEGLQKGSFDVEFVEEHAVKPHGSKVPKFYVCVSRTETCPLCESGNFAAFVGLFAIIDTTVFVNKEGKKFQNKKKILAAKGQSIKKLAKKAQIAGGSLAGVIMDVSRSDSRSATVGDEFEIVGTFPLEALGKKVDPKNWEAVIAIPDWAHELTYLSAVEMRERFHFDAPAGPGYQTQSEGPVYAGDGDGDDELPIPGGEPGVPTGGTAAAPQSGVDMDQIPF
jgi:hypothetical protein